MPKKSIRERLLALRRQLSSADCQWRSLSIQRTFLSLPEFSGVKTLSLYSPIHNEVSTGEAFHQAISHGKRVVYPRVEGEDVRLVETSSLEDMGAGSFGVLEPEGDRFLPIDKVDLVVVPGIAFDQSGHRLGYGKGFYDRLLHGAPGRTLLVGFCFDFQMVDTLPAESHDIRMDILITENSLLRITREAMP